MGQHGGNDMNEETKNEEVAVAEVMPVKTSSIDAQLVVGERGLAPANAAEMFRLATFVAQSGLAPKGMSTAAQIMVAMQIGAELGITPMRSVSSISVINGKPSISGTLALGLLRSKGVKYKHLTFGEEFMDDYAQGIKTDTGETWFSVADAKRAKLWGKDGPWTQYPARMLFWRAVGHHCSEHYSAELFGIPIAEAADFGGSRVHVGTLTPTGIVPMEAGPDPLFTEEEAPSE
jgi:hypothetical protein